MGRTFHQKVVPLLLLGFVSGFILGAFQQWRCKDCDERISDIFNTINQGSNMKKLEDFAKNTSKLKRDALFEKVRILCWIMTTKNNYPKAAFPMRTWARRCNKLIFVSDSAGDGVLPIYDAKTNRSGREGLWHKAQAAFKHVHKTYRGQYDWVLKADEDSYVQLSNLRVFLQGYNPKYPILLGERWFHPGYRSPSFVPGGAGYVLSTEAVDLFVAILNDTRSDKDAGCRRSVFTSEEEPMLAECLYQKVFVVDTRDQNGWNTFHQHPLQVILYDVKFRPHWKWHYGNFQYWLSMKNPEKVCCTNYAMSFHYLDSKSLMQLEFFVRHVNPFNAAFLVQPKIRKKVTPGWKMPRS